MKSLEDLTAALLRKAATGGQEGHGRSKDGPSASRDMIKRHLTKKKFREEDLGTVDPGAAGAGFDTAGLERALARAKTAVLKKAPADGDDLSLSERMSGAAG